MKLNFVIHLVALIALALGYQSGKEYKYKLETYIYTSIRNSRNQCSGSASIGDVIIQTQNDNFLIKINDIRSDVVNQQIEGLFEKYPFTFKDVKAFSDHISKPFKAIVLSGQMRQIYIGEDEPEWSINWKKSFLNLLQLSLKSDSNASSFYTIPEKGSFGECDTTYTLRSEHSLSDSDNVLNVTKVRNYDKCIKRVRPFRYASEISQQCSETTPKRPILQTTSVYDYNLKGSLKSFVIEKVSQREHITSAPFGKDGLTFDFKSKRVLELLSVNNISKPLIIPEDVIPSTDLSNSPLQKNEFFDNTDLRRAHFLRDIYRYQTTHNQIVSLLDESIADYLNSDTNSVESELPSKYGEIVDAVSTLDYEGVEKVFKSAVEKSDDHRSLFIDALVSSATNPSFLFIKNMIEQRKVHGLRARSILTRLSLNIKESSETLFDEYFQLCTSSAVQESPQLKRACYLTFSALVGKECVQRYKAIPKHIHNLHKKISDHCKSHCNPDIASKYFKLLISKEVNQQITAKETILLLKTAGNLRAKEVIPFLKTYIKSSQIHYIRAAAVWRLMSVARSYPEEVRSVCVPLFYNKSEEQDIRIASLLTWLSSGPSLAQMHLIAKQLLVETNRQVVNMGYTTVKWLSESEHPCLKPFARDLQSVLWLFKIAFDRQGGRVRTGDSRSYIQSIFDEPVGMGGIRHFSLIANNMSYIPNSIYFSVSDFIASNNFDIFGVSIQSYGLEKVVNRLLGRKGVLWTKPSFLDVFRKRTKRDTNSVEDELKIIEKSLPFETRESEAIMGDISIYNQGYTIAYIDFDEQLFTPFLKDGTISIPDIQTLFNLNIGDKVHRFFSQSANRIAIFRSEVGMPYFFEYKTLTQTNIINNKLSFDIDPGLFSEDRNNRPPTEFRLSSDIKFISNSHSYAVTGILLPVITTRAGVGISRKTVYTLPLTFDMSYDIHNNRLEIKKVPKSEDLFYDKLTPFTYLDSYANKIPLISEPAFKPIYDESHVRKFDKSFLKEYLGFGLRVEGNVRKSDRNDWFSVVSDKSLSERLTYFRVQPMANPYEIRVRTSAPVENPSTLLSLTLSSNDESNDLNELNGFYFNESSYFKDYTSRRDRRPEIHSLEMKISGTGNIERNITAKIKYMYSKDRLFHQLNANYERSAANDNGFKVCAVSSMKFPNIDLKRFVKLETLGLIDNTVNLTTRIAFGQSCDNESKINLMAQMSQTEEQKLLETTRSKVNEEKPNPYANNYNYCLNSFKFKYDSYPYCHRYLYPISQMRKVVLSVNYENISERVTNYTQKVIRFLSRKHNQYSDMSFRYDSASPGHLRIESNTSVSGQKVDYRLYAPYYTQIYKDVPLPQSFIPVFTFPLHDIQYIQVLRKVIKNPQCIIQGNIVQTFDNVTYSLPNIDPKCYTVIAKDCSNENNFLVLAKKDTEKSEIIVYLNHKYKIEFIPEEQGLKVRVNGSDVVITESEPFESIEKIDGKDIEMFSITYNNLYHKLDANRFGLSVSTDGFGFSAGIERYYAGKVCGICGDNNGDATHEFRASNGRVFRNSDPFAYSYVLKDSNCLAPDDWDNDIE